MQLTENLKLFKYDTIEDSKLVYDINKCLNDNWDKIDEFSVALIKQVDEEVQQKARPIGQPIFRLNDALFNDEIRLEGAAVSRVTYSALFKIYGSTYGIGDGENTFNLPNFLNRTIWGSNTFGYIEAGLPNITGWVCAHNYAGGAFWVSGGSEWHGNRNNNGQKHNCSFDASRSNAIYGRSGTVQPPAIRVRVVTRYK